MTIIRVHNGDISSESVAKYTDSIAVDTETLGLIPRRDRLCIVQLSPGDGTADIIRISPGQKSAPNLEAMLSDQRREKIFHYGRFDIAVLFYNFGVVTTPVFCTKIASRLVRTYTNYHSLKNNLKEILGVDISKMQQSSDWGADDLSSEQLEYAAKDVIYLHALRNELMILLEKNSRVDLALSCFEFLMNRAKLDLLGWDAVDIFSHS
ncbi:ribonuclease D [Candidatus Liberibacter sp.]|uniref:ribonuclease D n=1 Tax=Candidatus Liberibacter sp. TaxID=34022 RepID=UPI0015F62711|nr:ribonuclease D [Candidatus Liberibacter sp.]MBA5723708.1 ribonuclease D [Candidatus Liberibacter sp.]